MKTAWFAAAFAALCAASSCRAQEVYVGTGNGRDALLTHPEQWKFVRQNADGFYVNFIQMLEMDKEKCSKMADLFTHKNAFFESDSRDKGLGGFPDGGQFSRALQAEELNHLLDGGFTVKYASLNYGVGADKKNDLQHIGMKSGTMRPVFAQFGPWNFGGDLAGDTGEDNARTRRLIEENDGGVTDGPLGFWQSDFHGMRGGSISLVKFSHSLHKKAIVMVCPYGAGNQNYDFGQWLTQVQKCVRDHEDAGAAPDVWSVFEYATNVAPLPETTEGGKPANTTMGAAYWLLHHLRDPHKDAKITAIEDTSKARADRRIINVTVRNESAWLDLCPVVSAHLSRADAQWTARFASGGGESASELPLTGDLRLWPRTTRRVQIVLERRTNGGGKADLLPASLFVGLRPNPSAKAETQQQIVRFSPASAVVAFAKKSK